MSRLKIDSTQTIGVAGAGTMGLGIAHLCALAGFKTILFDLNSSQLNTAVELIKANLEGGVARNKITEEQKNEALQRIETTTSVHDLQADCVIEAVVEKLAVKKDLFNQLEQINGEHTIFASNTSSIPITQIGACFSNPSNFGGLHFFNPAHVMKLVEVISGASTSEHTSKYLYQLALKLGRKPVEVLDSPGFIVNRVARHFYVESLRIIEDGVTDFESVDKLLESAGFKMGPFRLMDLIGIDTNFAVTETMFRQFYEDPKFRPNRIQKQKVDAGHLGRKSGRGFYEYP
jgi:3-hydroxybutyryl-CoA dehydrogenase